MGRFNVKAGYIMQRPKIKIDAPKYSFIVRCFKWWDRNWHNVVFGGLLLVVLYICVWAYWYGADKQYNNDQKQAKQYLSQREG
jgi:hypothetical protein